MGRLSSLRVSFIGGSTVLYAGPPQNVSLTASSSTSLHLDWIEPELDPWDGTINEYGINCTSHFGYYHYSHIGSTQWYYDIFGLKPFSYYTCCVNAMTTNGDSTYTCDMEKTLQDGRLNHR